MFKKIFSYIVCLFTPQAIVDAINDAVHASDVDPVDAAGLKNDIRSKM